MRKSIIKTNKALYLSDGTTASQLPPPTPVSSLDDTATPAVSPTPGTSDEGPQIVMELRDQDAEVIPPEVSTDTDQRSDDEVLDSQEVERFPARKRAIKNRLPKTTQKRRRAAAVLLTPEQERDLAEWLEHEVPFIYMKSHKDHVDKLKVNRAWEEKGASLHPPLSGTQLSTWYDSVRTRFSKATKPTEKSGQGASSKILTVREKWITEVFAFLTPHIIRQRRINTLGLQVCTMYLLSAISSGCLHTNI